ncbi:hypothetical protein ACP70R_009346 [Stipagrostis hirtigluma subsp. patula]
MDMCDRAGRLCIPAEVKLYFSCLYDQKGNNNLFLKTTLNYNQSTWVLGCEPGWACSIGPNLFPSHGDTIPPRSTNCQE